MTSDLNRYDEEFGGTASDLDVLLSLDNDEELTPAQLAALARLDDGPLGSRDTDDPYAGFGPGTCPPEGWDLMTDAERQALLDTPAAAPVPEVLDAGFTHRDGGDGRGFAAGSALDQMAPGGVLAAVTDRVWANGLNRLSDDELVGTMDQLRAKAFTARLTGQPIGSLLPLAGAPAAGGPAASAPGRAAGLAGSVNLTMPAPSWLGQSDKPGQISGLGAADAGTCRDVADTLARAPATRWCVTLLGTDGRPVAHGCARAGPGHRAPTEERGSPKSRSPRSRPGPAPTAANRPGTSPRTRCGTSSRSEA